MTSFRTLTFATLLLLAAPISACSDDGTAMDNSASNASNSAGNSGNSGNSSNSSNSGNGTPNADANPAEVPRARLFTNAVERVEIEIDYVPGAEPYTDYEGLRSGNPWELSTLNIERMFQENGATVVIPSTLDEMEEIELAEAGPYTASEILEIAEVHQQSVSTETDRSFYVVFLDDFYEDDSGTRDNVLGVSIGNTGVVAMFKPVIAGTGGGLGVDNVRRFVEQTTFIHEFGHAAGLVDNGLAMVEDHRDDEHGRHCIHDDCVMYYANEGANDIVEFVSQFVVDDNVIVFGPECLADVDAASE